MLFLVEIVDERVALVIPFQNPEAAKNFFFKIAKENSTPGDEKSITEAWNDGIKPAYFNEGNGYSLQLVKS